MSQIRNSGLQVTTDTSTVSSNPKELTGSVGSRALRQSMSGSGGLDLRAMSGANVQQPTVPLAVQGPLIPGGMQLGNLAGLQLPQCPPTPGAMNRGERLITRQELKNNASTRFFGDARFRAIKSDLKNYHKLLGNTDLSSATPHDLQKLDRYLTHLDGKAATLIGKQDPRSTALQALRDQVKIDRAALQLLTAAVNGTGPDSTLVGNLQQGLAGHSNMTLGEAVEYLGVGALSLGDAAKLKSINVTPHVAKLNFDDLATEPKLNAADIKTLVMAGIGLTRAQVFMQCKPAPTIQQMVALQAGKWKGGDLGALQKSGGTITQALSFAAQGVTGDEGTAICKTCAKYNVPTPSGQDIATVKAALTGSLQDPTGEAGPEDLALYFRKGGTATEATQFQQSGATLPDAIRIKAGGGTPADLAALMGPLGGASKEESVSMLSHGLKLADLQALMNTGAGMTLPEAREYASSGCTVQEKAAFGQLGFNKEETLALTRQGFKSGLGGAPGQFREANRANQPDATKVGGGATGKTYLASYVPVQGQPAQDRYFSREIAEHPDVEVWGVNSPDLSPVDKPRTAQRGLASCDLANTLQFNVLAQTEMATLKDPQTGEIMAGTVMVGAKGEQAGNVQSIVDPTSFRQMSDEHQAAWNKSIQNDYGGNAQGFVAYKLGVGEPIRLNPTNQKWEQGVMVKVPHDISIKSGELRQQMAQLQLLDIISGQRDRHANNYFVANIQGHVVLTGIDNDMAWGTGLHDAKSIEDGTGFGKATKTLTFPPAATQADINSVNNLTDAALTQMLQGRGFPQDEIDAAKGRLQALKDHFANLQPDQIIPSWDSPEADAALLKYGTPTNCLMLRDDDYFKK